MVEVVETGNQLAASEKVRLIGIDAPDLKQEPWGLAARDYLQQLIGDRSVLLESDEEPKDEKYERRFGYLWSDRTLLNEQLILQGYALFAARSPNNKYDQRLVRAQEFARIMERGIWNHQKPMRLSPAEFRRQYR
jgi:micrococcal nuclease